MIKIAVVGAKGKMGSVVCKKLETDYDILKIDIGDCLENYDDIDLVVDFATHESSVCSAEFCEKRKIPLVIGSTGQTKLENEKIKKSSEKIAIIKSGNFSKGVAILKELVLTVLKEQVDDVIIFEKHHKEKKDSPSGTALELASLFDDKNCNLQILAERGGKEIGTHEIDFYFGNEKITLSHQAFSREAFADGVLIAIKFVLGCKKTGLFSMQNVLN